MGAGLAPIPPTYQDAHQRHAASPGAVTLRGAWNFQTPDAVIRVETDWYVHDSEFRYVLQPGETISASHSMPIGQVMFVPREEIALRDGTEEEIAARHQSSQAFYDEKGSTKVKTPWGLIV